MTIGAIEVPQVPQIDRVLELRRGAALAEDGVANGALRRLLDEQQPHAGGMLGIRRLLVVGAFGEIC